MSQMRMVEKGKSSSSSEKESCSETTLLVGKTSRQTETSISSSKGVKEICETERKTSSRVKTNSAIVASSTTSCVRAEGSTPRADLLRTSMVVRFRPGQPNQQG